MSGEIAFTSLETGPDDDGGWNLEGSGLCSIDRFSRVLAIWLVLQDKPQTIGDAVHVFNAPLAGNQPILTSLSADDNVTANTIQKRRNSA